MGKKKRTAGGGRVDPAAMTPAQLARLLAKASGHKITVAMIRRDIEAGAPTNPDGTLHLVHYAAWLSGRA